jgi:hypothetical protein
MRAWSKIKMTSRRTQRLEAGLCGLALISMLVGGVPSARAQQAEAKDAARNANCTPGKVETLGRKSGRVNETWYKIACVGQKDAFIVIHCRDRNCTVIR